MFANDYRTTGLRDCGTTGQRDYKTSDLWINHGFHGWHGWLRPERGDGRAKREEARWEKLAASRACRWRGIGLTVGDEPARVFQGCVGIAGAWLDAQRRFGSAGLPAGG